MRVTINAMQLGMAPVQLKIDRTVVEAIRPRQTSQSETPCPAQLNSRTQVFDMAASAKLPLSWIDAAVQSVLLRELYCDRRMAIQARLRHLGNARRSG